MGAVEPDATTEVTEAWTGVGIDRHESTYEDEARWFAPAARSHGCDREVDGTTKRRSKSEELERSDRQEVEALNRMIPGGGHLFAHPLDELPQR